MPKRHRVFFTFLGSLHPVCFIWLTRRLCSTLQIGLDFYESQMVGTLPTTGLSSDVTSYRGNAFQYENALTQAGLLPGFANITGGWCTGDEVGESRRLPARA